MVWERSPCEQVSGHEPPISPRTRVVRDHFRKKNQKKSEQKGGWDHANAAPVAAAAPLVRSLTSPARTSAASEVPPRYIALRSRMFMARSGLLRPRVTRVTEAPSRPASSRMVPVL